MEIFVDQSLLEAEVEIFGERVRQFRKAAGLTQEDFAEFMGTDKSYVSKLEKGLTNLSLEMMVRYADFFGVKYYELGNPKFPIPSFEKLPASTRKAIKKLKGQQQAAKADTEKMKAANREEGIPGRAKQLHGLVAAGFFKKPKTAKDSFVKLNPDIPKKALSEHTEEIGKITITLSQGRFLKLLDKLEPAPNTLEVRFVEKKPGVVPFTQGGNAAGDLAADEGGHTDEPV